MTPHFSGRVDVIRTSAGWVLDEPLAYHGLVSVRVPAQFVTDFASIPRLLRWWLEPADARWCAAALVHDRAYETRQVSRATADALLFEAMGAEQPTDAEPAPMWLRWLFWAAVRFGGWWAYKTGPARQMERRGAYLRAQASATSRIAR